AMDTRVADSFGYYAGDGKGAADSWQYAAPNPKNWRPGGTLFGIHFPNAARLKTLEGRLSRAIDSDDYSAGGFIEHDMSDALGGHKGMTNNWLLWPVKHIALNLAQDLFHIGTAADRVVGDKTFIDAANTLYAQLLGNPAAKLTPQQLNALIERVI